MAALRIYARGNFASLLNSIQLLDRVATSRVAPAIHQIQQRWSSYKSSPIYKPTEHYTNYEVTNDPNEWKYVERLFGYKVVPKPPTGDIQLPSGYKPARASPKDYSYFIERSKNYMQPVYLLRSYKGQRRITEISRVQGDIWKLERDLKEYLEENTGQKFFTQINEFAGIVKVRGDYVNRVKEWMDIKGF